MIYTFYSFKGGVGRSMAMANIAELLCRKGLRVLMVDFDLEAPGLERYFYSAAETDQLNEVLEQRGIIDMLVSYKDLYSLPAPVIPHKEIAGKADQATNSAERVAQRVFPFSVEPLRNFCIPIHKKANGEAGENKRGELLLMPAGRRKMKSQDALLRYLKKAADGSGSSDGGSAAEKAAQAQKDEFTLYAERVRAFDWNDFYANWQGEHFFDWFRENVKKLADVILIDSRTGVAEMSGVCTHHLADAVVLFVAANYQNLFGTEMIAHSLSKVKRGSGNLRLMFVPSRIESAEKVKQDEFAKDFLSTFEGFTQSSELTFEKNAFVDLKVPYVPYYSYTEDLAAHDSNSATSDDLLKPYNRICLALAQLDPRERNGLREKFGIPADAPADAACEEDRRAEEAFKRLPATAEWKVRSILTHLVRLTPPNETGPHTCRRVALSDFDRSDQELIFSMVKQELLKIDQVITGELWEPEGLKVQLASEGLIQNWNRLKEWLEKDRDFLLWRQSLRVHIDKWEADEREKDSLLFGSSLLEAKEKLETSKHKLNEIEKTYIQKSIGYSNRTRWLRYAILLAIILFFVLSLVVVWNQRSRQQTAVAKTYMERGIIASNSGQSDLAIELFGDAIAADGSSDEAYLLRGKAYAQKRSFDEAIADFTSAININPDNPDTYLQRGLSFLNRGDRSKKDYEAAVSDLTHVMTGSDASIGEMVEALYNRGIAYSRLNQDDLASADFSKLIKQTPRSEFTESAHLGLGQVALRRGDYTAALASFEWVAAASPDNPEGYYYRGKAYSGAGDSDQAIADFSQAIKLKSDYADAYLERANAYQSKKSYAQAINDFDSYMRSVTDNPQAYLARGDAYYFQRAYDRALADYGAAIKLKPDLSDAYFKRGLAYAATSTAGATDQAIADFTSVITQKPDFSDAYLNRGLANRKKGNRRDAISDFNKVIQLNRNNNPDGQEVARRNLLQLGVPTSPGETTVVLFYDNTLWPGFLESLKTALSPDYQIQDTGSKEATSRGAEILYFHNEDEKNANAIKAIVEETARAFGQNVEFKLRALQYKNTPYGRIEVWLPSSPASPPAAR